MKLTDFRNFELLNSLKERMGIPRDVFGDLTVLVDAGRLSELELEKLTSQDGLEISIDDLRVLDDGTLAYKNSRVLLYIRDVAVYGGHESQPRFHVSNCSTLITMREKKRFSTRYVVSTRTDGQFNLNFIDGNVSRSSLHRLMVCQNCLGHLGFNGFLQFWGKTKRAAAVQSFALEDFFVQFPRSLHVENPKYNSDNAPLNTYGDDFSEISLKTKSAAKWICQKCGFDLSSKKEFLHTHHKNGAKFDNNPINLSVLCYGCHADEPDHQHMKSHPSYAIFKQMKVQRGALQP
jgi:hypothetical protein